MMLSAIAVDEQAMTDTAHIPSRDFRILRMEFPLLAIEGIRLSVRGQSNASGCFVGIPFTFKFDPLLAVPDGSSLFLVCSVSVFAIIAFGSFNNDYVVHLGNCLCL